MIIKVGLIGTLLEKEIKLRKLIKNWSNSKLVPFPNWVGKRKRNWVKVPKEPN